MDSTVIAIIVIVLIVVLLLIGKFCRHKMGTINVHLIAIILIFVVISIGTPIIKGMLNSATKRSCCNDSGGRWVENSCSAINTDLYNEMDFTSCVDSKIKK